MRIRVLLAGFWALVLTTSVPAGVTVASEGWISDSPSLVPYDLSRVVAGNGAVAAVGGYFAADGSPGAILHSVDGAEWTVARHFSDRVFGHYTYETPGLLEFGNGVFVAIGRRPMAALSFVSTDGSTWREGGALPDAIRALHFGNGTFVALGNNDLYTSTDGRAWTRHAYPAFFNLPRSGSSGFGGGKLMVQADYFSAEWAVTTDFVTWTRVTMPRAPGGWDHAVEYANGRWIMLESTLRRPYFVSTDAISWMEVALPDGMETGLGFGWNRDYRALHSVDGEFWLESFDRRNSRSVIRRSSDGETWTVLCTDAPRFNSVARLGDALIAVGTAGGKYRSMDGGRSWTTDKFTDDDISAVAYGEGTWLAVDNQGEVFTSADGGQWLSAGRVLPSLTLRGSTQVRSIAYGAGTFVATSTDTFIAWSDDGVDWTLVDTSGSEGSTTWRDVTFGDGLFVACSSGASFGYSANGKDWAYEYPSGVTSLRAIAYGAGRFVAVSSDGKVVLSSDGRTWTSRLPGADLRWVNDIIFADGRFCAVGQTGYIAISSDGLTWTQIAGVSSPGGFGGNHLESVTYHEGRFIAAGFYGRVTTSADGQTWTSSTAAFGYNIPKLHTLASNGRQVFAGGADGVMLRLATASEVVSLSTGVVPGVVGQNLTLTSKMAEGTGGSFFWSKDGAPIPDSATLAFTVSDFQPAAAGLYSVEVATKVSNLSSEPTIVAVATTGKVAGHGTEVGSNILAPNGNTYDQILLEGAGAAVTADGDQITRISFIDLDGDIVQAEMNGPGSMTVALEQPVGPALPEKYSQDVRYMQGLPRILITGATERTNLTVFSVGRGNAYNQALFVPGVAYDGVADLAYIAVASTDGKFGGLRAANVSFVATKGYTGVYAPGVAFTGPVYIGDISAFDFATPVIRLGSVSDCRITGGDLFQGNGSPVAISGITTLSFQDGTDSHGRLLPKQANQARLTAGDEDVTQAVVR